MKDMIVETIDRLLKQEITKELLDQAEKGVWTNDLWEKLKEYGMLTVGVQEDLGGTGGDYEDGLNILRIVGKYSAPIPLAETYIVNWFLNDVGEKALEEPLTFHINEKNSPIQLKRSDDGWIVNGTLKHVPWARHCKKMLTLAEIEGEKVIALISLEQTNIIEGTNLAGEPRDTVVFNNLTIKDCKVFKEDMKHAEQLHFTGTIAKAFMMCGALENIQKLVKIYSGERTQFGRPINRFQAIQQHIAILTAEAVAATVAANGALTCFQHDKIAKEIAFAKIKINEAAGKVSAIAHQVIAAIGFTHEHQLHYSTRRLWAWRDEFGTETEWANWLVEQLRKIEKDGLWAFITNEESFMKRMEKV